MPALSYKVMETDCDRTVGEVLRRRLLVSRTHLQRARNQGGVWRNGRPVWTSTAVQAGDWLTLTWAEATPGYEAEPLPVRFVFEDAWLAVIDKPAGQLVHPARQEQTGTIVNGLLWRWRRTGAVPRPVHRLDRGTSGLLVVAKDSHTHQLLARALERGTMERTYEAIVAGCPAPGEHTLTGHIALGADSAVRRVVTAAGDGKPVLTEVRTLGQNDAAARLEVRLGTGRTHQIRAQLAAWGHPLLGDTLYGGPVASLARPALHASRLAFTHPYEKTGLVFTAPLPADLAVVVEAFST